MFIFLLVSLFAQMNILGTFYFTLFPQKNQFLITVTSKDVFTGKKHAAKTLTYIPGLLSIEILIYSFHILPLSPIYNLQNFNLYSQNEDFVFLSDNVSFDGYS
jgi:hypothetical protein